MDYGGVFFYKTKYDQENRKKQPVSLWQWKEIQTLLSAFRAIKR